MNRLNKSLLLAATVCASTTAMTTTTYAEVSANVAISNDYRFRGISQNDRAVAISGGFDYAADSGFYAGVWASSVDFQIQTEDDATVEVDYYIGYGNEIGDTGLAYDINILTFNYPNSDADLGYNFTEVTFGLSYSYFGFSVSMTDDYFANSGSAEYYNLSADVPLPEDWTLSISAGQQDVEDNNAWGTPNWQDYKIGVSGEIGSGIGLEIAYIDTSLEEAECFGGLDWCDGTVVVTFSKSM